MTGDLAIYPLDRGGQLFHGDCIDVMQELVRSGKKFDSIVTDPPYHLTSIVKRFGGKDAAPAQQGTDGAYARASRGFMGKEWDGGDIAFRVETWDLALQLLNPGGHLIAFSGSRTYHRMAVAIEDAGFEIRDQIMWLYGSGFPKSHDVSKGIDKKLGADREKIKMDAGSRVGSVNTVGGDIRGESRPWIEQAKKDGFYLKDSDIPATPEATLWQGWGTALKPAHEPMVLARKPFKGSVAENVMEYGTGAINIDACRVGDSGGPATVSGDIKSKTVHAYGDGLGAQGGRIESIDAGRWPANVIHDGSDEVVSAFPDTSSGGAPSPGTVDGGVFENRYKERSMVNHGTNDGSAARFFYSAKAQESDRMGSKHPTVKPIDLMAYLIKLVTPPGGSVLDIFAGSGSTGIAAVREGFKPYLIERDPEYIQDILNRFQFIKGGDTPLFKEST